MSEREMIEAFLRERGATVCPAGHSLAALMEELTAELPARLLHQKRRHIRRRVLLGKARARIAQFPRRRRP